MDDGRVSRIDAHLPSDRGQLYPRFRPDVTGIIRLGERIASRAEAFRALVDACHAAAVGLAQLKLFTEGTQVTDAAHPLLPLKYEEADDYLSRVAHGPEFAIYCGSVQLHSTLLFDRLRGVLAGLFGPEWVPAGWIDAELFVGRYAYTPGGPHQEERYNLHCVLDGEKTMLVWPDGAQPAREEDALVLPGGPGDMIHWPPGQLHVGRSPRVSIGVNMAVYPSEPFDVALRALAGEMHRRWSYPGPGLSAPGLGPPTDLRRQLELLLDAAQSPGLAKAAAIESLRVRSACGFRPVPPRRPPVHLAASRTLRRVPGARLFWTDVDADLVYLGNGHVGRITVSPAVTATLSAIDAGDPFSVSELAELCHGKPGQEDLWTLAEDLYSMRVVDDAVTG